MQFIIIRFFTAPAMPAEDPLGIGVDDKAMMISSVKEYAICGFGADAVDEKEPFTDSVGIAPHQALYAGAMFLNQYVNKIAKALGLDIKVAGRADKLRQLLVTEGIYLSC